MDTEMWTPDPRTIKVIAGGTIEYGPKDAVGIFHVTRSVSLIRKYGIKPTSDTGVVGFGQGRFGHYPHTISATWSLEMAIEYFKAMKAIGMAITNACSVKDSLLFLLNWFRTDSSAMFEESLEGDLVLGQEVSWNYRLSNGMVDLDGLTSAIGAVTNEEHFQIFMAVNKFLQERISNVEIQDIQSQAFGVGILGNFNDYRSIDLQELAILRLETLISSRPIVHAFENELKFRSGEVRFCDVISINNTSTLE